MALSVEQRIDAAQKHDRAYRPSGREARPWSRIQRSWAAPATTLLAAAVLVWGLSRPALWLDETVSVVSTQRTWAGLPPLLHGADAPLVPFYVLLKAFTALVTSVLPAAGSDPEVLYRAPSVIAAILAVWALTSWVARQAGGRLAVSSGTLLVLTVGFSRYGQEARPYALVILAAVASTIAWSRSITDPRRRWIGLYAVTVGLLLAANLLAGSLLAAHLVASLIVPGSDRRAVITARLRDRLATTGRTLLGAGLGLLLVSPFVVLAGTHGTGPARTATLRTADLLPTFVSTFTGMEGPLLAVGGILLLALVGLSQLNAARYWFVGRIAGCWAIVPLLVLLPVLAARPNLLVGRYFLFVVPAWAVLAGLGVVTICELAITALGRITGGRASSARLAAAPATWTAVAIVLAVIAAGQLNDLQTVRGTSGHGDDVRPALAAADSGAYARLPILSNGPGAMEIAAYRDADSDRLLGQHVQHRRRQVWPTADSADLLAERLRGQPQILLLLRAGPRPSCRVTPDRPVDSYVRACMPAQLKALGYTVASVPTALTGRRNWTLAVLQRPDN